MVDKDSKNIVSTSTGVVRKALEHIGALIHTLFELSDDAILLMDQIHFLDCNPKTLKMFGCQTQNDILGKTPLDFSPDRQPDGAFSREKAKKYITQAMEGAPQRFEWKHCRLDRTEFDVEVSLNRCLVGGKYFMIAVVCDITARKHTELEKEQLNQKLKAASQAKDQFLAMLSHELRTPLAAIAAGTNLLRVNPADTAQVLDVVEIIECNIKLQARLVNDLLDATHLSRGLLAIQRSPLRFGNAAFLAAESCRADAERAGINLENHPSPELWINADSDRIQQIVINLVTNAIKFTPKGGRVQVSVVKKGHAGHLIVEDTGIGIEADQLTKIFEMFNQSRLHSIRAPGLGLGLSIVKSIVELHGGRVWAESAGPGCGSKFTVELPLCAAPKIQSAPIKIEREPKKLRLLLLEDNGDIRFLLTKVLSKYGFHVLAAESGEQALEILRDNSVDVILADVGLPGMDGYEFLHQARTLATASHALAYAVTGYDRDIDRHRSHEVGYIDHIVKPINAAQVAKRIREDWQRQATGKKIEPVLS